MGLKNKDLWLMKGNCIDLMKNIESNTVDLSITSPPYDDMRNYNGNNDDWCEKCWKSSLIELFRVTKDGGILVWVVGDKTSNGCESLTSFKQAIFAVECGFNLHDTMIYEKAQACFGSNKCYLQSFEYMFVFSKGKPKSINLIRDRENVRHGKAESTVSRGMDKDGVSGSRIIKASKKFGKRKNIWKYGVGGGKTGHPAVFPQALADDHVKSWSKEGDTILDPFMGSGTVGISAKKLNRKFIGIELDENYFNIAENRINT